MINKINTNAVLGGQQLAKLTNKKVNDLILYQKPIVLIDQPIVLWNMRKGYNAEVTMKGNRTLSIEQLTVGDYGTIKIIQDTVGTRTLTLPTTSIVMGTQGASTLTLSTAVNSIDIATFYYDGVNIFWTISLY